MAAILHRLNIKMARLAHPQGKPRLGEAKIRRVVIGGGEPPPCRLARGKLTQSRAAHQTLQSVGLGGETDFDFLRTWRRETMSPIRSINRQDVSPGVAVAINAKPMKSLVFVSGCWRAPIWRWRARRRASSSSKKLRTRSISDFTAVLPQAPRRPHRASAHPPPSSRCAV